MQQFRQTHEQVEFPQTRFLRQFAWAKRSEPLGREVCWTWKRRASFPSYGRMPRFLPTRLRRMMEKMSWT